MEEKKFFSVDQIFLLLPSFEWKVEAKYPLSYCQAWEALGEGDETLPKKILILGL